MIASFAMHEYKTSLKTGSGTALSIAFASACAVYTFTLYPFFMVAQASARPLFEFCPFLLSFLAPALTMNLIAEERRECRLGLLTSLPIGYSALIVGKFFGAWLLFVTALACTLCIPLSISWIGPLDWGPVVAGYMGMLLAGSAYLSIGLWMSCIASTGLTSWLLAVTICFSLYLIGKASLFLPVDWGEWARSISVEMRLESFTRGVIDSRDVIYFLVISLIGLTSATQALRRERAPSSL